MTCHPIHPACPIHRRRASGAFTLIEVAVASAIMALALFGFISVCSTALKSAKSLNRVEVDASSLALHCVPAINLLERRCDRIHVTPDVSEFHVLPDRTRPMVAA